MSYIYGIEIKNFRGIRYLKQKFINNRIVVLIGRGDAGKSTILIAIHYALWPSWNLNITDLDFYNQDTSNPIEIIIGLKNLPEQLFKEQKFGLYVVNDLSKEVSKEQLGLKVKFTVDESLEPKWTVLPRTPELEEKNISAADRALIGVNYIGDYTDNQFSYNRQSPLYALTKSFHEEGIDVEKIKSTLIRDISDKADQENLKPLLQPLESLKKKALLLGLPLETLSANLDIKDNPFTGSSISLHHNTIPYRLQGKGSKRLMSIAIQTELANKGGVVLVDELEQGLEPDRISTLMDILSNLSSGQVFVSTHSPVVIRSCKWQNIYIVSKDCPSLSNISINLAQCQRYNPEVFFAPKIICCEGDTEFGILSSLDIWLKNTRGFGFTSLGIVLANVGGGNKMFTYASWLKEIGFDTCVFADDDLTEAQRIYKEDCNSKRIPLFLCQPGKCIEKQCFEDLPWSYIEELINCDQRDFPKKFAISNSAVLEDISRANTKDKQQKVREEQAQRALQFKWFKHIPGGMVLGQLVTKAYEEMNEETHLKKMISDLLKWCGF